MKFLHLLEIAKKEAMPDKEKIRRKALKAGKNSGIRILAGLTAAVLMLGIISGGVYFGIMNLPTASACDVPEELKGISPVSAVRATSYEGSDITTDAEFKVTTAKAMSGKELKDVLEITPNTEYSVKKNSGNSFTLSFDGGLEAGTLYTVSSKSAGKTVYSWAFQTDDTFRITSYLPVGGSIEQNGSIAVDFSHSNVDNFEECFSIYPAIPGTFEHHGRRWLFIPSSEFELNTLYTVNISKNITGGDNETLSDDFSFSFASSDPDSLIYVSYTSNSLADCFLPTQIPAARIEYLNTKLSEANVTVYNVPNAQNYINIHKKFLEYNYVSTAIANELSSCVKVTDFTASPVKDSISDNSSKTAYIQYPLQFESGYYISEIKFDDITLYHIFQVTELAVYSVSSNGDYTVWVNSTAAKSAVSGATVEIEGFEAKTTDDKGLAVFKGGKASSYENIQNIILKVSYGSSKPYITSIIPTGSEEYNSSAINYYSYIYTDSELYRPGDKINVWGFVIPRTDTAEVLKGLKLHSMWDDKYADVKIDENGGFTAQLELSDGCPDDYSGITLTDGENDIVSRSFCVSDYELPTYTLEISTDKNAYFAGEQVNYTVNAYLFDKTPAANVSIQAEIDGSSYELTTDETGTVTISQPASYYNDPDYPDNNNPIVFSAGFTVTEPDGTSVNHTHAVAVFKSDITAKITTDSSLVNLEMYTVSTDKLNSQKLSGKGDEIYYAASDTESYTGEIFDTEIYTELHEVKYEKDISGSVYNPVTMQVEHSYSYNSVDTVISTDKIKTSKGKASLPVPDGDNSQASYYYLIYADDTKGNTLCIQYYNNKQSTNNSFKYILKSDKQEYVTGENIKFNLEDFDTGTQVTNGTLLLSGINADIITNNIYSNISDVKLNYEKLFSPGVCISGAYFDGDSVHLVQKLWLNTKRQELDIQISPDREKYNPGDNVTLDINVRNANGAPAAAQVNISVIDSALRSLFVETHDIYSDVYFPRLYLSDIRRTVSTYLPDYVNDFGYGEGGGGGDYERADFELSPYFETITLDSTGSAKVSFKLPDSITSWSVTAQAFTADAKLGQKQINIVSSKDFYISVPENMKIKTTDDAVFPIKFISFEDISQCRYTLELLRDGNTVDTQSADTNINSVIYKNYGKLEKGEYTLKITGKSDCGSDAVSISFSVEDGYLSKYLSKRQPIESNTKIESDFVSDVTVNIYDEEYDFYFTVIEKLLGANEDRIEQVIGSSAARALLSGLNSRQLLNDDAAKLAQFQNSSGFQLFTGNDYITAETSAKITAAAGWFFNKDNQTTYYTDVLNNSPTLFETINAYWALAALGQPVLNDLNLLKESINTMQEDEALCLALAFAYAGDYKTARDIYDNNISDKIKTANGIAEYKAQTAYDTENMTVLAAMLAVKINTPDAKALTKYILGCDNLTASQSLVLTVFLNSYVPYLEKSNTVEIAYADGRSEKLTYPRIGNASIKISYSEIDKISFSSVTGSSIMTVSGNVQADNIRSQYTDISDKVSLSFSCEQNQAANSIASVSIKAKLPENYSGNASVNVQLPYCVKILSAKSAEGGCSLSSDLNKAELFFADGTLDITLECYLTSPGIFTVEPLVLTDTENKAFAVSSPVLLTVEN